MKTGLFVFVTSRHVKKESFRASALISFKTRHFTFSLYAYQHHFYFSGPRQLEICGGDVLLSWYERRVRRSHRIRIFKSYIMIVTRVQNTWVFTFDAWSVFTPVYMSACLVLFSVSVHLSILYFIPVVIFLPKSRCQSDVDNLSIFNVSFLIM